MRGLPALAAVLVLGGCSRSVAPPSGAALAPTEPPAPSELCITRGHVRELDERTFAVDVPVLRGVVPGATEPAVEVAFVYDGPTRETEPLASGELRQEIALKLRARDSCNVVYVVWKIEPVSEVAVLVKANPGVELPQECGDRGYRRIKPESSRPVPPIRAGETHLLRARIEEKALDVFVDDELAWQGTLPDEAFAFDGPVGIRTDNARFRFRMADSHGPIGSIGAACEGKHAAR